MTHYCDVHRGIAQTVLKRILQPKLDQASWNHCLRDVAEVRQVAAEIRVGRDREYRMVEEIEEVGPKQDCLSLANAEILHDRKVAALLKWTAVDVAHARSAEAC